MAHRMNLLLIVSASFAAAGGMAAEAPSPSPTPSSSSSPISAAEAADRAQEKKDRDAMIQKYSKVPHKETKPDPYGLVTCSTTTESRTLTIATKEEGGCELHYEKYGKDRVISWSVNDVNRCVSSRDKVRKELEAAGWKCIQE